MYKATKLIKYVAIAELILVPFFTKPRWCIEKFKGTPEFEHCGFYRDFMSDPNYNADDEYKMVGYPSSRIIKLDPEFQSTIDLLSYSFLLYFTIIRMFLKKVTKTALIRCIIISCTLLFLII